MKLPARSVAWLLPFFLTACFHVSNPFHKARQVPPQATAPPIDVSNSPKPMPSHVELPASASTIPSQPTELDTTPQEHRPEPKPPARRRKPAPAPAPAPAPPAPVEQASNVTPGVSAIGQLSSGEPSDSRRQTEESIKSIEHDLNGINRNFSDQEQRTVAQIREFLKQAKTALSTGDVDGAHTLAAKAKVLLSELSQ